jgi:hypothetical protein
MVSGVAGIGGRRGEDDRARDAETENPSPHNA